MVPGIMRSEQFEQMSIDELWTLHTLVDGILAARIKSKKDELERRLRLLDQKDDPTAH
ncbi:hypothetical protein [Bradyrhizobium liaoningense]|uniref:hypothetical protein n=1 Tax=Bradyrhizobium liaoningense TaxID=43992 RepID=UPI001BA623A4|nr:hypothetical protein [Bradyrhizobium liaoningense]MBR0719572.1 hypothetical protein [Bradyrhizobium liaoningense]